MKYYPEEETGPSEGIPSAEPGIYIMNVVNWDEDVQRKDGVVKDVVDFTGDNADGVTVGSSLWMRGPYERPDGTKSKGTLWQYRELAKALGEKALEQYRTKDANGFSMFRPTDWKTIPVKVTVSTWGVDKIEPAPAAAEAEKAKTSTNNVHTPVADDEIPF